MNQYNGAVFFVDMLGVGALTQNQVPVDKHDFMAWRMRPSLTVSPNLFCARLLTEFRYFLAKIKASHEKVNVAQLSDCAYIWSDDVLAVLEAVRVFMWSSVSFGLLSRGGLAYGEIVEPDKVNYSIGQFVLGGAVTRAVALEKSGKGCRVFVDGAIKQNMLNAKSDFFKPEDLRSLKNPLDGTVVEEFCWYRTGVRSANWQYEKHNAANQIVKLVTLLQYFPRFGWNEATPQGRIQLACSIDAISEISSDFIGNANYIFRGESYLSQFDAQVEIRRRTFDLCKEKIDQRQRDVERFFLNDLQ